MKLHNALDRIVGHKVKARILRLLCDKDTGWTGRQIARELAISPTTSSKFLKELTGEGVVFAKGVGKAYLYRLNEKSYVVRNILMPFFEREKGIISSINALVKKTALKSAEIETIATFGSIAKNTDTSRSDVDLLIIIKYPKDKTKVEAGINNLAKGIAINFNTTVSPYILSAKQFKKRYHEKSPLIIEILKSYKLLYGTALERVAV
jgi:predicted nucleotidyltransferase